MKKNVLVIFKKTLSQKEKKILRDNSQYQVIIARSELKKEIEDSGYAWTSLEDFLDAGSIYTANALVQELSQLTTPEGSRLSKSFIYKGYELWWINYDTLFFLYCLPYSQYKRLLEHLVEYEDMYLYEPPFQRLFGCFLNAYGKKFTILREPGLRSPSFLPLGVFLQILLTLAFLPMLMIQRRSIMVYISDEFHKSKDYHFRMGFIYEELRKKNLPFVEFIRSIEPWRTVIQHAFHRKRPVLYTDAVSFIARFMSYVTGGRLMAKYTFNALRTSARHTPEQQFKLNVATQYLLCVYDDVWAIRIMRVILHLIGVKSALIVAAMGRNFQCVLGCKLNNIPIIGILHGVASQHYNVYDFMPQYDGEKVLSVDKYGVWSDWWKEYYATYSRVYKKEQLYVSGPMRPMIEGETTAYAKRNISGPIKVLLVSEQLAVPEEVLPYLEALMKDAGISLYIVFRPYLDGFGTWLEKYHPDILEKIGEDHIFRNGIKEGIPVCDVIVGSHSTAVLEALLVLKPMVFFFTKKWGDYFDLKEYPDRTFLAENPTELLEKVRISTNASVEVLQDLQKRFFGNPYQNGSKWAIEEIEKVLASQKKGD